MRAISLSQLKNIKLEKQFYKHIVQDAPPNLRKLTAKGMFHSASRKLPVIYCTKKQITGTE